MEVKVKLLDRNLIRKFGGVVQMMDLGAAKRFAEQGKVIIEDESVVDKMESRPAQNKAVFHAPENKMIESFDIGRRYPGPEDKLFPIINNKGK